MVGWLCLGVFEDFFHCLGEPAELRGYPQTPGAFRFDRVMARIDAFDRCRPTDRRRSTRDERRAA